MNDESRYAWEHTIATRKTDVIDGKISRRGLRVSLTFRYFPLHGGVRVSLTFRYFPLHGGVRVSLTFRYFPLHGGVRGSSEATSSCAPCAPALPLSRGEIHTRGNIWSFTVG